MNIKKRQCYIAGHVWDRGPQIKNEDACCIYSFTLNHAAGMIAIICDGIGSLEEGQNASSSLCHSIETRLKDRLKRKGGKPYKAFIYRTICEEHYKILKYSQRHKIKMGTTLCMIYIHGTSYDVYACGDTRVYAARGRGGQKSNIWKQISMDQINERGQLTAAIGIGTLEINYYRGFRLKNGDTLLICSDGFYRRSIPQEDFKGLLSGYLKDETMIVAQLKKIVTIMRMRGEKDNCSAICIRRIQEYKNERE